MKSAVLIAFLSLACVRAGEFDKERLLPLLRFPLENFEVGFAITQGGVGLLGNDVEPEPSPAEELARAELRREMHPEDPANYTEIGFLHKTAGNSNAASAMFAEAGSRYRTILARTNPPATEIVEGYAIVLRDAGENAEAGELLRAQVQKVPKDSAAWGALADHEVIAAYLKLTGKSAFSGNPLELHHAIKSRSITPVEISEIEKQFTEAIHCYGRAIELSPRDSALYRKRMIIEVHASMMRDMAREPIAQDANTVLARNIFAHYVPGLREISKLEPTNPEAVAALMFAALIADSIDGDISTLLSGIAELKVSVETMEVLRDGISKLNKLSKSGEAESRRVALVSLGFFQSLLGEKSAGEKNLKRAIALDRSKALGWETLSGIYVIEEPTRWKDLFSLARERSKYNDSARNRYIAAKAAVELNDPVRAMTELQAGLKLDPQHVNSQLATCVVLLREGSRESIEKAHALVTALVERKNLDNGQWRDLMIVGGVLFALGGQQETAREWFETLRQHAPDEERAKVALAAWKE